MQKKKKGKNNSSHTPWSHNLMDTSLSDYERAYEAQILVFRVVVFCLAIWSPCLVYKGSCVFKETKI